MDYFESVIKKINNKKIISITKLDVKTCENDYAFELFKPPVSDEVKKYIIHILYLNYHGNVTPINKEDL